MKRNIHLIIFLFATSSVAASDGRSPIESTPAGSDGYSPKARMSIVPVPLNASFCVLNTSNEDRNSPKSTSFYRSNSPLQNPDVLAFFTVIEGICRVNGTPFELGSELQNEYNLAQLQEDEAEERCNKEGEYWQSFGLIWQQMQKEDKLVVLSQEEQVQRSVQENKYESGWQKLSNGLLSTPKPRRLSCLQRTPAEQEAYKAELARIDGIARSLRLK